jgi:Na+-driven multidrug efflux pump
MKRDAIDLSTLNVFTLFRKYFVPTLLGMLSMSAVTAIDGIFVGHGVGSDGIAAVNICVPLLMLFTGIGLMVGAGCSVVASIQLSRGKSKSARLNVTQALLFVTIVALIPSALMMAFPAETARMLGSSEHLLPMVTDYLLWFVPSWVFQIWITVSLFVIRLDGSPKLAMLCSLITAVINVVLDWLFIFPFGWGVMGAAFATSISIMAGGLVAMVYLLFYARHLRLQPLKWSVKSLRLSVRNIGYQCRIGPSALLGEATLAVLMFVGNQVFMSYLGDDGVGAFGIAYYIPFVFMVGNAIAQSAQPIISYNFGLGYKVRVMTAERIALLTAVVCGVVATVAFTVYPYLLVRRFTVKTDEKANQQIRINSECHRCNHTANHSRQQRNTFRRHHSYLVAQSEIIADNRLGRLCNSITYHENKRNIIRYTECPYTIVPQIGHKYLVPDEHKNSKRCLSQ